MATPIVLFGSEDHKSRFLPKIEEVVRAMEGRIRGSYDYFKPTITPNELGFDLVVMDGFLSHRMV